jgi:hypothetical protein
MSQWRMLSPCAFAAPLLTRTGSYGRLTRRGVRVASTRHAARAKSQHGTDTRWVNVMHQPITSGIGFIGAARVRRLREAPPGAVLIGNEAGYPAHRLMGVRSVPAIDAQRCAAARHLAATLPQGADAVVHLAGETALLPALHSAHARPAECGR